MDREEARVHAINLKELLRAIEREAIENAMRATNGNCARAAKLLGMGRTTLIERRRSLGMPIAPPNMKEETDRWELP